MNPELSPEGPTWGTSGAVTGGTQGQHQGVPRRALRRARGVMTCHDLRDVLGCLSVAIQGGGESSVLRMWVGVFCLGGWLIRC